MNGTFYGVSVGPGDPELLTLKAVRLLTRVNIIATPRTYSPTGEESTLALEIAAAEVDFSQKEILKLDFLMSRNKEKITQRHEEITETIAQKLRTGEDVAMLNLGDASLYATCSYIMEGLKEQGFALEIISGVPSFCAMAGTLQSSLTTMQEPLHILPYGKLQEVLPLSGNKVVMKTGKSMAELKEFMAQQGELWEVQGVERCGLPEERIFYSLDEIPDDTSYFTTLFIKRRTI